MNKIFSKFLGFRISDKIRTPVWASHIKKKKNGQVDFLVHPEFGWGIHTTMHQGTNGTRFLHSTFDSKTAKWMNRLNKEIVNFDIPQSGPFTLAYIVFGGKNELNVVRNGSFVAWFPDDSVCSLDEEAIGWSNAGYLQHACHCILRIDIEEDPLSDVGYCMTWSYTIRLKPVDLSNFPLILNAQISNEGDPISETSSFLFVCEGSDIVDGHLNSAPLYFLANRSPQFYNAKSKICHQF